MPRRTAGGVAGAQFVGALTVTVMMMAATPGLGAGRMAPNEIKSTFFNGEPFTASTPSNVKFKMVFTPDGKVTREPVGKSGTKGDGTWKLNNDGFCTSWKGNQPSCFVVLTGDSKWSVMKGTTVIAVWTK